MPAKRTKTFFMYFSFGITVLIVVLTLKLFNWIPHSFLKEDIRKYKTIEEATKQLKLSRVYVPAYFPDHIQWPPREIFAQKKPFVLVMVHFAHTDTRSFALSVYQADAKAGYEPQMDILYMKQEHPVLIKGKEALLRLAVCRGNIKCNSLSWTDQEFRITLVSDDPPEQMQRMAESMIHE